MIGPQHMRTLQCHGTQRSLGAVRRVPVKWDKIAQVLRRRYQKRLLCGGGCAMIRRCGGGCAMIRRDD